MELQGARGIALALSALFLLSAVLAWMPWASWPAGMTWMAAAASSLPVALAAVGRVLLTRADRKTLWLSFRCLPGRLQAVLGVLAVTGVLMAVIGASQENNLQTDGVEDGRHYVYDTTPSTGDVPRSRAVPTRTYCGGSSAA